MVLDNIISLELVLANGTITTASQDTNPELFWGMRGAGHNLAIVTRMQQKVYDDPVPNWFYAEMQFPGDKIESFSEIMNSFNINGTQTKEMALIYSRLALNASISTINPVIVVQFTFAGSEEEARPYLDQLFALEPITRWTNSTLNPTQLAEVDGLDLGGAICADGGSKTVNPSRSQTIQHDSDSAGI